MSDCYTETVFDLAIVGGGPAGLAAGLEASRNNWNVIILEQLPVAGGKALDYVCKADDQCRSCGVCQVCKAVDDIKANTQIIVLYKSTVTNAKVENNRVQLEVRNSMQPTKEFTVTADRLILATGFEPFDLKQKPTLGYGRYRNVISLEILENHLRQNKHIKELPIPCHSKEVISMAFIQCVGSRDIKHNAPYCSQVCCRVALRLAHKIKHLHPETLIDLFYMDLQTPDFNSASLRRNSNINLIRAIPSEVTRDDKGLLNLRYEISQKNAIQESTYDLVVLAGAIRPALPIQNMNGLAGLTTNSIGFWDMDVKNSNSTKIGVAGVASGPMDILSAMAHGRHTVRDLIDIARESSE